MSWEKSKVFFCCITTLSFATSGCSSEIENEQKGHLFSNLLSTFSIQHESQGFPTDPLYAHQWYLKNTGQRSRNGTLGIPEADIRYSLGELIPTKPREVILAVIDSGIDLTHPDIDHTRLYFNPGEIGLDGSGSDRRTNGIDDDNNGYTDDSLGWSFSSGTHDVTDTIGHGTHVAGLLASKNSNGQGVGNLWRGFKLMPLQIFDARHPTASHNTIAQAIRYAVDNGAQVISASFGSATPSETLRAAVEYAAQHSVILVSAVGNFRKNTDTEPTFPAHFGYSNQIAVGASERRDLATTFTNFGQRSVDIFAPGDEIISTELNGTYAIRSGTSQACPLVSGAVATAKYLHFNETSEQIIERVLTAADALPALEIFSTNALRLNVDNIIQNKKGTRWTADTSTNWKSISFRLESEHPYRSNISVTHQIEAPPHTKRFKIRFEKFSTQSTDVFEIIDKNNKTVLSLSGNLGSFWSPEISGNTAYVKFITDRFVSDYGWTIDQIRYLE